MGSYGWKSLLPMEGDFKGVCERKEEQLFTGLGQPGQFSLPRDLCSRQTYSEPKKVKAGA